MENHRVTVISQYANAPRILSLIDSWNDAIDPSTNIDDFVSDIWDVTTATGYGLDVWGRIVGISRNISGVVFDDESFRLLILFKAFSNIAATTIPVLNILIRKLFVLLGGSPTDRVYVIDLGNMTMMYVFEFALTPDQSAVINTPGVLPHPTGVGVFINEAGGGMFGFSEMGPPAMPFG